LSFDELDRHGLIFMMRTLYMPRGFHECSGYEAGFEAGLQASGKAETSAGSTDGHGHVYAETAAFRGTL
jgi:hypothetical protein